MIIRKILYLMVSSLSSWSYLNIISLFEVVPIKSTNVYKALVVNLCLCVCILSFLNYLQFLDGHLNVSQTAKQGQIKTGAPCRSERLAKYNQVNIIS